MEPVGNRYAPPSWVYADANRFWSVATATSKVARSARAGVIADGGDAGSRARKPWETAVVLVHVTPSAHCALARSAKVMRAALCAPCSDCVDRC